ncbi:hypothetical protein FACS1894111_10040 [Clostridia bacterium]|nr:hypothetical protein FACS1894111_10040 [Clostridia bacterium]
MSDAISRKIIVALLDKYERSIFFREKKAVTRRILLNFYDGGKSDFPYYDIEQSERRIRINGAVEELCNLQMLSFEWMKGERNHIIAKVWLNPEKLEAAYQFVGRKAKSDEIDEILSEILAVKERVLSPCFQLFLQDVYETISRKRSMVNLIPGEKQERQNLFKAICGIDEMNGRELTERAFSLQYFGDSKMFERSIKARMLRILRKYQECDDDSKDEEVLRQVGIFKYPEQFEFCGNISLVFERESADFAPFKLDDENRALAIEKETVDFASLHSGGSIYIADLLRGNLVIAPDVKMVLTIENKANYIEYVRKFKKQEELVLYHGGHYSPSKKRFFLAVHKAMPRDCLWMHWGDIDFGGFSMLARLRCEVEATIKPYHMGVTDLMNYKHLTAGITEEYAKRLVQLMPKSELADCRDCLEYMLEHKVRLEQEAMLIEQGDMG